MITPNISLFSKKSELKTLHMTKDPFKWDQKLSSVCITRAGLCATSCTQTRWCWLRWVLCVLISHKHTPEILIKSFRSIIVPISGKKMRRKKSATASLVEQLDENPFKSQHRRAKANTEEQKPSQAKLKWKQSLNARPGLCPESFSSSIN